LARLAEPEVCRDTLALPDTVGLSELAVFPLDEAAFMKRLETAQRHRSDDLSLKKSTK
jgi:hypothetical protein